MGRGGGGGVWLTVVECAAPLDTHGGSVDDDAATLGLLAQVVQTQSHGVHDTLLADIDQVVCGLLEVTVGVDIGGEVVGLGTETSVGENVVDTAVSLLGLLEEDVEISPACYVGLDPGVSGALGGGGGGDIAVEDKGSEREQELDGSQTDTRRTTCKEERGMSVTVHRCWDVQDVGSTYR